jgi:predicted methyltransferase
MRPLLAVFVIVLSSLAGCAHSGSTEDAIAEQLAAPARSADDRERDARDHPQAVLAFAGFGRGDTIADIFGGGGYYSEILSGLVGPRGRVLLVNNAPYDAYAKKGLEPRLAGNRLPNVRYSIVPNEALGLGQRTLDGALIVMSYHDLYHVDPDSGWPAIDAGGFIDQIVVALKPGGRLLIVDHAAREGSGKADAQTLHRIEESFAISDFKAHGLQFVGSIDLLRNRDDDRSKNVFDAAIKGRTDRFVHVYRKPGA